MTRLRAALLLVASLAAGPAVAARGYDFSGSAFVNDDGTLSIRNRVVHLWGILVPATREDCLAYQRPPECGPRAALALGEGIRGFVRCRVIGRRDDGTVDAQCFTGYGKFDDGIDLAAYLLNRGWALAAADAPDSYRIQEAVARHQGLGLWGTPRAVLP